jgi:putative transposase
MPDHMHAILTPAPDVSLEKAVQFIKGNFSHRLKSKLPVWTPSFNETQVRNSEDFESFRHYIHQNPIRANLASITDGVPLFFGRPTTTGRPTPQSCRSLRRG